MAYCPVCFRDVGETRKALIERLFAAQGRALQAFLFRRTRRHTDAADLAQEVYVRMLRIEDPDKIVDIDAYLFTAPRRHGIRRGRRGCRGTC